MDSYDLIPRGFKTWYNFDLLIQNDLLENLPNRMGVYVIIVNRLFGRLRGSSDIFYIGSATNQYGIRFRIRQYFHPGQTQRTNLRIRENLMSNEWFKLSYVIKKNKSSAKNFEKQLLKAYKMQHGELPPLNQKL